MALTLILSLAACGGCSSEKKSESNSASAVETAQATEQSEQGDSVAGTWANDDESGETITFNDDETLTKETMAKLVGDWTYTGMEDYVKLTFNEDGTGSYDGIDVTGLSFTYELTMEHKEYGNGEPYIDQTLKVNYSTGESEEIVIGFLEEGQEKLTFHTTEGGGYNGVITDYGAWIRA